MLRGTTAALPPDADLVTICNQLPDLMGNPSFVTFVQQA